MSNNTLQKFDHYLTESGPAALVVREQLVPVEGADGVLFPSTFAAGDGFAGGYNIDGDPNGENIALIDSVGSQANRIEPLFAESAYAHLVPQITIKAGEKSISLLQAGHRAGDAIVRCSALKDELQAAFKKLLDGDATPLAKIAPTSLVFGVWDSRETQAKSPRLIASTIRAYNVRKLTRHAQFIPAVDYVREGLLTEPEDLRDSNGKIIGKHPFAQRGFTHIPVTKTENTHGGVIAKGGIRRDATLGLAALRSTIHGSSEEATILLHRYLLGLALVAFTKLPSGYLRQGTILVLDPDQKRRFDEVHPNGKRQSAEITHEQALEYATATAKEFGVSKPREVKFDIERAKGDVSTEEVAKPTTKKPRK
jgi:CRISPR-associated protein Csb1